MTNSTPNMENYEEDYENFQLDVPEFYNFGFDVTDRWAEDRTKLALITVDELGMRAEQHSFWDLKQQSDRFVNVLKGLGVSKGDRVFIMLGQTPDWYIVMLGMMKLGVVPMPATTLCTTSDIVYRVNLAEANVVITDMAGSAKVEEAAPDCPTLEHLIMVGGTKRGWVSYDEQLAGASSRLSEIEPTRSDDPLIIYFTSGTVGYPKMVLHTQASYGMAHITTAKLWHDLKSTDLQWTITDTGWAKTAYGKLFGQWIQGAAILQQNTTARFDPALTLEIISRFGVTSFCAPPTVYRMMVLLDLTKYDLESLRHCTGAGEPLNPEVMKEWEEGTGMTIYDGYGQTETVLLVANYRAIPVKPGSMGKPTPGAEIAIVDEDGEVLPPGQEGQIAVKVKPNRPVGLFREYWKAPDAMASSFQGDWYLTGDKASMDEDGYFWFIGRADDVIISAGYRIGPFEVESALIEHPAVAESAVVASPDPVRGDVVKAFVVLAPGYVESDELVMSLQDLVKNSTAPYKYPRKVEFVIDLPKTISGKIRRIELRERELAASSADGGS